MRLKSHDFSYETLFVEQYVFISGRSAEWHFSGNLSHVLEKDFGIHHDRDIPNHAWTVSRTSPFARPPAALPVSRGLRGGAADDLGLRPRQRPAAGRRLRRSDAQRPAAVERPHRVSADPIPTTDYYALAGIFQSTDLCAGVRSKMGGGGLEYYDTDLLLLLDAEAKRDPELGAKIEATRAELKEARAELVAVRDDPAKNVPGNEGKNKLKQARQRVRKLQAELIAFTDPALNGKVALGVRDAQSIRDTEIRIRGEAEQLGPVVPRGFLRLLPVPNQPQVNTAQSGRLELAQKTASAGFGYLALAAMLGRNAPRAAASDTPRPPLPGHSRRRPRISPPRPRGSSSSSCRGPSPRWTPGSTRRSSSRATARSGPAAARSLPRSSNSPGV